MNKNAGSSLGKSGINKRESIYIKMLELIERNKLKDSPFVVGLSGIDTSGKTQFSKGFEDFLLSKGLKTQMIHLDDFHNPKAIRYSGENQAESYYYKSFNLSMLIYEILEPIRNKEEFSKKLELLNLITDKYEREKEFTWDKDTIIIFEGVFLFRNELVPFIDLKVFIDIPMEESIKRASERDVPIYGEEVLNKYHDKYIPAQKRYLAEFPPSKIADLIIDNTDWENPYVSDEHCKSSL